LGSTIEKEWLIPYKCDQCTYITGETEKWRLDKEY